LIITHCLINIRTKRAGIGEGITVLEDVKCQYKEIIKIPRLFMHLSIHSTRI
jgi:hypothetical protein